MAKAVTVNQQENRGLSAAAAIYSMFLERPGENSILDSVGYKFVDTIKALPNETITETITVELTDEEAAVLVRAIDLITGRDASLESVRTQLGGGEETTQPDPEPDTTPVGALLDLLFGGAA